VHPEFTNKVKFDPEILALMKKYGYKVDEYVKPSMKKFELNHCNTTYFLLAKKMDQASFIGE